MLEYGYNMSLGLLVSGCSQEDDWSFFESPCYHYNFDATHVSCIEARFKQGGKPQNDGSVLADPMMLPVIFLKDYLMSF